jgi:hypothetical protein
LLGDIDGSGLVSLVAVNENQVFVMRRDPINGGFKAPESWWVQGSAHVPYGTMTTLLGNVTGLGGKASIVAVSGDETWVMTPNSSGTAFGDPVRWSANPFYGTRATLLADIRGIGYADLVAVNDDSTYVMLSTGASFLPPALWSSTSFFGTRATLAGDV